MIDFAGNAFKNSGMLWACTARLRSVCVSGRVRDLRGRWARREKRPAARAPWAPLALSNTNQSLAHCRVARSQSAFVSARLSAPCVRSPCALSRFCVCSVCDPGPQSFGHFQLICLLGTVAFSQSLSDSRATGRVCPSSSAAPPARWHSTWESCSPPGKHLNHYRAHMFPTNFHSKEILPLMCTKRFLNVNFFT